MGKKQRQSNAAKKTEHDQGPKEAEVQAALSVHLCGPRGWGFLQTMKANGAFPAPKPPAGGFVYSEGEADADVHAASGAAEGSAVVREDAAAADGRPIVGSRKLLHAGDPSELSLSDVPSRQSLAAAGYVEKKFHTAVVAGLSRVDRSIAAINKLRQSGRVSFSGQDITQYKFFGSFKVFAKSISNPRSADAAVYRAASSLAQLLGRFEQDVLPLFAIGGGENCFFAQLCEYVLLPLDKVVPMLLERKERRIQQHGEEDKLSKNLGDVYNNLVTAQQVFHSDVLLANMFYNEFCRLLNEEVAAGKKGFKVVDLVARAATSLVRDLREEARGESVLAGPSPLFAQRAGANQHTSGTKEGVAPGARGQGT